MIRIVPIEPQPPDGFGWPERFDASWHFYYHEDRQQHGRTLATRIRIPTQMPGDTIDGRRVVSVRPIQLGEITGKDVIGLSDPLAWVWRIELAE